MLNVQVSKLHGLFFFEWNSSPVIGCSGESHQTVGVNELINQHAFYGSAKIYYDTYSQGIDGCHKLGWALSDA